MNEGLDPRDDATACGCAAGDRPGQRAKPQQKQSPAAAAPPPRPACSCFFSGGGREETATGRDARAAAVVAYHTFIMSTSEAADKEPKSTPGGSISSCAR